MAPHQTIERMAVLLAASGCDLGDERDVLRTLKAAEYDAGDIVALSDAATELARVIRANTDTIEVA